MDSELEKVRWIRRQKKASANSVSENPDAGDEILAKLEKAFAEDVKEKEE